MIDLMGFLFCQLAIHAHSIIKLYPDVAVYATIASVHSVPHSRLTHGSYVCTLYTIAILIYVCALYHAYLRTRERSDSIVAT